jgi:hypothetical protein
MDTNLDIFRFRIVAPLPTSDGRDFSFMQKQELAPNVHKHAQMKWQHWRLPHIIEKVFFREADRKYSGRF